MSDIKFRAWDGEKMTAQIELRFAHGRRLVSTSDLGFGIIGDDKCVLMQFTGFKDKNGKNIYDDDVVRFTFKDKNEPENNYGGTALIARTMSDGAGISFDFDAVKGRFYDLVWAVDQGGIIEEIWDDSDMWHFEVIGNIHENPELIK